MESTLQVNHNWHNSANQSNLRYMTTARESRTLLLELSRLTAAGRRPRTEVWFPLLVFGLINLLGTVLAEVIGRGHLGLYFFPMNILGGLACAAHYYRSGRTTGLQAPALAWLGVIFVATIAGATCSFEGREQASPALNLAGPMVSLMFGYLALAAWARSTALLTVVAGTALTSAVVLPFARGDRAISLQLLGFAATMLAVAVVSRRSRSSAT
jgi:hypothetical protein